MQTAAVTVSVFSAFAPAAQGIAAGANPLAKVVDLMNDLHAKVVKDGEDEAKAYKDFYEWCDDAAKNSQFSIQTAKNQKNKLEAHIADLTSRIEASTAKVEDLANAIATGEAELKDATAIRAKETDMFTKSEQELVSTVDAVTRAVAIIERDMAKNPAAFAQVDASSMANLLQALSTLVDAAALSGADHQKLVALVQSQQGVDDDDDAPGAPAASSYKSHSGGIMEVLEDLKEKAETELSNQRKGESKAKHNFDMLAQSLNNEAAANRKHMKEEQSDKAAASADKATAEGDLAVTSKALSAAVHENGAVGTTCMTTAADHESTVRARAAELKVIEEATRILKETTSGAVSQTYSFFQSAAASQAHADLARLEVVSFVKQLARRHHSSALAQLASRIAAVAKYGSDPFAKVKGLIQDMIAKLEKEGEAAATEKAWCDEQLAKTEIKKSELDDDISKLSTKLDQASARSAQLKAEVKALQGELAALAQEQAEMDKIRQESHAAYTTAKADLELGVDGVRKALDALRSYYSASASSFVQQPAVPQQHSASSGAGQSIIDILEVIESDFADNLAKEENSESDAQELYEKTTHENQVTKTIKDQDVKFKTQEFTGLDQSIAELSSDRDSANAELSSVMQYYGQVKGRCIAKPETYEDRQAKRQSEIDGLKQALSILENDTALLQRKNRRGHGHIRGALVAQ